MSSHRVTVRCHGARDRVTECESVSWTVSRAPKAPICRTGFTASWVSCGTEVRDGVETVFEFSGTDALVPQFVVVHNAIRTTMRDGVSPQRDNCTNATVRSVVLLVHVPSR
jgi:hypothetical protein